MSVVAGVVEECRLGFERQVRAHGCEAPAALVAAGELDDGLVQHLRVDEVDVARLAEVGRRRERVADGEVGQADLRERLEVARRVVEDLRGAGDGRASASAVREEFREEWTEESGAPDRAGHPTWPRTRATPRSARAGAPRTRAPRAPQSRRSGISALGGGEGDEGERRQSHELLRRRRREDDASAPCGCPGRTGRC